MQQPLHRKVHQSHAWRSLFKKQFHKTKLCRYYSVGQCRYGEDCPFAHSQSELTVPPDLTKTTLCKAWLSGTCTFLAEQCPYAHGEEELRTTPVFGTSSLCKRRSSQDAPSTEAAEGTELEPRCMGPPDPPAVRGWPPLPDLMSRGAPHGPGRPQDSCGKPCQQWSEPDEASRREPLTAVVHLADFLEARQGGASVAQREDGALSATEWAVRPPPAAWGPVEPVPVANAGPVSPAAAAQPPAEATKAIAAVGLTTGASVPTPSHVPVPQLFGEQHTPERVAMPEHEKLTGVLQVGQRDHESDLAALCASLADAQTATPGSLLSASPMRSGWARTPSSAASPERTSPVCWARTPSPTASPILSPRRKASPAYVAPTGTVHFHGLPQRPQELPGSPEVRWARTPSTVASPSLSPQRRVGIDSVRALPGQADLPRLDDIFNAATFLEPLPRGVAAP